MPEDPFAAQRRQVVEEMIAKTFKELSEAKKRRESLTTRQWQHFEGYKYLAVYKNSTQLREKVRHFTSTLPKSEYRLKAQLNDAARSTKRNIEEGYKRSTTEEYITFLGFSQGSLEEVKGDVKDAYEDGFMSEEEYREFMELINKTDYLLRHLVKSLEEKVAKRPGGYRKLMKLRGEG